MDNVKPDNVQPIWRPSLGLGLVVVLAVAAALRLWRLSQNGFGNEYYTAGVRSMSLSWHNFLYNSFDPGGFISVDKPPVALWIQVASVKLFGFHAFNVKMLAAFVVLPTFALVYFVGAPFGWWRRIGHLALAGVVLAAVSLSWVLAYDLTPPDRRPYAGTSDKNSMLELVVGPYGMGR